MLRRSSVRSRLLHYNGRKKKNYSPFILVGNLSNLKYLLHIVICMLLLPSSGSFKKSDFVLRFGCTYDVSRSCVRLTSYCSKVGFFIFKGGRGGCRLDTSHCLVHFAG
ncbi:unnamed protein product, partial [Choristocarpus tenellus]